MLARLIACVPLTPLATLIAVTPVSVALALDVSVYAPVGFEKLSDWA
jgi:hypothetical protein